MKRQTIEQHYNEDSAVIFKTNQDLSNNDVFPNISHTRKAILQSEKDFTFHIWTKPSSTYHTHENYIEIFIVTEGKLIHHFQKEQTVMTIGDAFLIFPGQYHKHSPYKNRPSQHINLTCKLSFIQNLFQLYFGTKDPIFPKQLIHLDSKYFETVMNYQQILLSSKNEKYWDISLKSFLSFIIGLFYIPEDEPASPEMPEWLNDFIQKLKQINFENDISLSQIYSASNYSQTTLCREFKKYTGKTLIAYINDLKLNYACNLLENTNYSMLTISNSLGFSSLSHFNHLFKNKYGISPLQYRRM